MKLKLRGLCSELGLSTKAEEAGFGQADGRVVLSFSPQQSLGFSGMELASTSCCRVLVSGIVPLHRTLPFNMLTR